MYLRSAIILLLLAASAQAVPTRAQNLQFVQEALGFSIENGYTDYNGDRNRVSASVFAANIRELRKNIARLTTDEIAVLKGFANREDGRLAYFMVKMTDEADELRLGYRKVYVGKKKVKQLLDFLLLDATYHKPLATEEQVQIAQKTGVFFQQDPGWHDKRLFRVILRDFRKSFVRLDSKQKACLKQAKFQVTVKTRRFQPESTADTSELRLNYDNTVTVSEDRADDLLRFVLGKCRG